MVGTAQADNFAVFIRKVGFSVGVESLLGRAGDFGRAYANVASFRESDWTELVYNKWKLKSLNVGDVFGALDIARIANREVYAGNTGEALGIVHKLLSGPALDGAIRFLVATAIVRFDGDIFLNALRSAFIPDQTRSALIKMVSTKREALFACFKSPRDREAIARVVSIERQKGNKGSTGGGGLSSLTRSAPLGARAEGLGLPTSPDIYAVESPSPDYLRKVTTTRRGWAESLGLFRDGNTTTQGDSFLLELSKHGFSRVDGTFVVWPTTFDLEANLFRPEHFSSLGLLSSWDFQLSVYRGLGGRVAIGDPDIGDVCGRIAKAFRSYKELSQHRTMIRNEMSSQVAYAVLLAMAFGKGEKISDIGSLLRSDLSDFGITVRPSKTIELAITVRPDACQTA